MAAGTSSTNEISSTKAAEIYRKDCGGIYYVCYHCGNQFTSISETLLHIDYHFSAQSNIKMDQEFMDVADIKYELLDNVSEEVVDASQLEQIFIDCSKSVALNEDESLQINTATYAILPIQETSVMPTENFLDMEGHFQWKCLCCSTLWNKFAKLQQHLHKHSKDPLPNAMSVLTKKNRSSTARIQYSFKCTLCPSEFFDSSSSRQHIEDDHVSEPTKCIPCGRKFVSTQLLKDHMAIEHANGDANQAVMVSDYDSKDHQTDSKKLTSQYNTFLCILCNKTFNGTQNLMQHTFIHFNLSNFSCTQCPAKFRQMASLRGHMVKKHFIDFDEHMFNVQCRFCSGKVENLLEFVTHTFTNHLDEGDQINSDLDPMFNYDCRFCFKSFSKWNDAYQHLETHKKDELPKFIPPPTVTTTRAFSERAKSGVHRSEFLYNCNECSKTLCGSFEARNHWITEHKNAGKSQIVPNETLNKRTGKYSLKCHDCDEVFCTQFNLMKHRLMHFKVLPYRCSLCAKRFSVSRNAMIHMIKIHNMKPDDSFSQLDCHYCQAEFTEEKNFITHMYNKHLYINFNIEENLDGRCSYECLYCKEVVHQRSQMSQHLMENHQNETIPDTEANIVTAESSMNALRHNLEFMYCCVYCPKKFRLPHPASEHVKYKHKIEKKEILQKKEKAKEKEKKPPVSRDTHCSLCNITFLTWRSMLNHRAKRHPETHNKDRYKNRPTYYCSTCGKEYRDRGNLNQHEETHSRHQSYTCDICNKTYRTKNYIQLHLLSHRNEKNFICDQCGRSFYSVSKLNTHSQIHQNLKLQCEMCDKVFFTRYNLSKHKKTHTTDTRKKCKLCDNYFKSTNSYRTHMLLHTGIKKYACRYCDMTFAQSSGRRGHEKIKHRIA